MVWRYAWMGMTLGLEGARKTLYLDSGDGVGAAPQMDLLTQELEAAARYRASVSESGRERVRGHHHDNPRYPYPRHPHPTLA